MKKILLILLSVLLLFCSCASAASLPYMTVVDSGAFLHLYGILSAESYPEVHISPYTPAEVLSGKHPLWDIAFPLPSGAFVTNFSFNDVTAFSSDDSQSYIYYVRKDFSYDSLKKEAASKSDIVLDDPSGAAAIIETNSIFADAILPLEDMDGYVLYLRISFRNLNNVSRSERAKVMKQAILAEVARIQSSMRISQAPSFWSKGMYQGAILRNPSLDKNMSVKLEIPEFTLYDEDGTAVKASMVISSIFSGKVSGYVDFGDGRYMEVAIDISTSNAAVSQKEKKPDTVTEMELADGNTYDVYAQVSREKTTAIDASLFLHKDAGGPMGLLSSSTYFSVGLPCAGFGWKTRENALLSLNQLLSHLQILDAETEEDLDRELTAVQIILGDEAPVETAEEDAGDGKGDTWTCINGHTGNTGDFCSECGMPRMD